MLVGIFFETNGEYLIPGNYRGGEGGREGGVVGAIDISWYRPGLMRYCTGTCRVVVHFCGNLCMFIPIKSPGFAG